jgi:hypothetical protein
LLPVKNRFDETVEFRRHIVVDVAAYFDILKVSDVSVQVSVFSVAAGQ